MSKSRWMNHKLSIPLEIKKLREDMHYKIIPSIQDVLKSGGFEKKLTEKDKLFLKQLVLNFLYYGSDVRLKNKRSTPYLSKGTAEHSGYGVNILRERQDELSKVGLIRLTIGKKDVNPENRTPTEMKASKIFKDILDPYMISSSSIVDESPLVELRYSPGKSWSKYLGRSIKEKTISVPYKENNTSRARTSFLKSYNNFIDQADISLTITQSEFDQLIKRYDKTNLKYHEVEDLDFTRKQLRSLFTLKHKDGKPPYKLSKLGGRYYHGWWMEINSILRPYIAINNSQTVEIDFKSMHAQMLYLKYTGSIYKDRDAYTIKGIERYLVKLGFNIILNNTDKTKAIKAMKEALKKEVEVFDDFIDPEVKPLLDKEDIDCEDIIKKIYEHHPILSKHEGKLLGLEFQYDDSEIMKKIIQEAMSRDIVVLPVHDSCITTIDNKENIESLMLSTFVQYYNYDVSNIKPSDLLSSKLGIYK